MAMNRRRFMFLAVALVALNTFFWLAAGGFALPRAVINQFFGNNMIRAEVLLQTPAGVQDWRIDRGVITQVSGMTLTLLERDGTTVTVQIDPSARVQGPARFARVSRLKPRVRVAVYHQANLPSQLVQVEGVGG